MKIVLQRVSYAKLVIDSIFKGKISEGLVALIGINESDDFKKVDYMVDKLLNLRIFEDEAKKMNRSLIDIGGEALLVSQFTLYGDTSKGRRPSFVDAAKPEFAEPIYNYFVKKFKTNHSKTITGEFGADMQIELNNVGPVTIILEK
jgi:D-aminoacyl-tRNA deacylase